MAPSARTDRSSLSASSLAHLAAPLKRYHDEAWHTPQGRLVREVIFGLNDGIISTVGFLAGVTATLGDLRAIVLAGMAAAVAGAVSMAMGAYVSAKSQRAFFRAEIAREAWEIEHMPEHEREEIRDLYGQLGFTSEEVEMIVRRVTSNPDLWLRFMSREELGLAEEAFDAPLRVSVVTGLAFLAGSLLILVPYLFGLAPRMAFAAAGGLAVATLLVTGAAKTWLTKENPLVASLELAGLGIVASVIGFVLGRLVGVAV
jgi:VIT1/CCC1 family predicted Fe2+/Mn2+ transporter